MRNDTASRVVIPALFAALLATSAWITIPIGTVPITLQSLVVFLAALTLPPVTAGAAVGAYVGLGALGVPIFAGAKGGLGVLAGPTGGYLVGFVVAAFIGALVRRAARSLPEALPDALAVFVALAIVYAAGWSWLVIGIGLTSDAAFVAGVAPFVLLDAAKAAVAVAIAGALRRTNVLPR